MKFGNLVVLAMAAGSAGCALQVASPLPDEKIDVLQYVLVAPVPLSKAITVAEDHTVGKAIKAELVRQGGRMLYRVLLTAQGRFYAATVDPVNAAVLEITPWQPREP